MPILKQSKKRVRQTLTKQARNYNVRTAARKSIRVVLEAVKADDKATAEKALAIAYKNIDMAEKKNILQKNTASRRKALLAKEVAGIKAAKKAEPKKKAKA